MNVEQIEVPSAEALAKAEAYAANPKADSVDFYAACQQAYEALAAGGKIIHLSRSIQSGGLHECGRPKLAIARADRKQVRFEWGYNQGTARFDSNLRWGQTWTTLVERVDMGQEKPEGAKNSGFALVPALPADVRPATGQLRQWFILWEVDKWANHSQLPEPPHDPLLLRKIRGELYEVLAEWDLTEIERAIMSELAVGE